VRAADTARETGEKIELEFRMRRKDSEPVWVIAKGRIYVEPDGQEFFWFSVYDNSCNGERHHQLLSEVKIKQMLIDQSGSIIFDWDLVTDTMSYSQKWAEHFGYTPVSRNYSAQMGVATHYHPDDLKKVSAVVEELKSGKTNATVEVRFANVEGRYLWTKITATAYRNSKGELVRIIGILQDIDEMKRAILQLKERAEYDSLTKLLNKQSTQAKIESYLAARDPQTMAGLLVFDLDNFKAVNDQLGHLFGDVVLTQVGNTLRKLFRSHDIIGRIGGDEFLVFVRDIPSKKLLEERCELLLTTLNNLLENLAPNLQTSCSVGVSLIPEHGTTFKELFECADRALYSVKSKGKKQYKIYSDRDKYMEALSSISRNTVIDSDDPSVVTNDTFERFVFRCLYESKNLDATIDELLSFVGRNFNVSRVYIFENNEDNTTCSNTFEWCNDGIEPQKDMLQNVSYITDIPGWPDLYKENNLVYCTDITQMAPQFRAILEPQGIKSLLHCAIMDQGVFRGYIGFDECRSNHLWTQEQISQLQFLAEAMSVFLIRERNKKQPIAAV